MAVLRAATETNAKMLGVADITGTVEPGKQAELLVLNGNPLEDITNIQNIDMMFKGGRIIVDNRLSGEKTASFFICILNRGQPGSQRPSYPDI